MQRLISLIPIRWKIILVAAAPLLTISIAIGIFALTEQRVLALNEQIHQKQLSEMNAIKLDKVTANMYMDLLNYDRFHMQYSIDFFTTSLAEAIQLSDGFLEKNAKRAKATLGLEGAAFDIYVQAKTKAGLDDDSGEMGRFNFAARFLERAERGLVAQDVIVGSDLNFKFRLMRDHEKDIILRSDSAMFLAWQTNLNAVLDQLSKSALPEQTKTDFLTKADDYRKTFASWYASRLAEEQSFDAVTDITNSLRTTAENNARTAEAESKDFQALTSALIRWELISGFSVVIFFAACALFMAMVLTRDLISTIKSMSQFMRALTRGETLPKDQPDVDRHDEIGEMARSIQYFSEAIEQRAHAERALADQNRVFEAILENMHHGVCLLTEEDKVILHNSSFQKLYELADKELPDDVSFYDFMRSSSIRNQPKDLDVFIRSIADEMARGSEEPTTAELSDGRTVQVRSRRLTDGSSLLTHEDISQVVDANKTIRHMAMNDALTGLPNRVYLGEVLGRMFGRAPGQEPFALLCLDLDHFKEINDTLGHPAGDELLRQASDRMRASVREHDVIARLGGDEFVIVATRIPNSAPAEILARRIRDRLSQPFDIFGQAAQIGVSIGIAIAFRDAQDANNLLKNADLALYRSKASGRNTYYFFDPEMEANAQRHRQIDLDLRNALKQGELFVVYQPIVSSRTRRLVGAEALVRWKHPERGLISPAQFIPVAEETGLINELGEFVLGRASRDAAAWPTHLKVAVNISAAQFRDRTLAQKVETTVGEAGLPLDRLEIEITESLFLSAAASNLAILRAFKALGIAIALDDFGTGYSSLSTLRSFPFDKIKIDGSFMRDVERGTQNTAIVKAIAGLGSALGVTTTAEGVETAAQFDFVRKCGCSETQGYFISKPLPLVEFLEFVDASARAMNVKTSS